MSPTAIGRKWPPQRVEILADASGRPKEPTKRAQTAPAAAKKRPSGAPSDSADGRWVGPFLAILLRETNELAADHLLVHLARRLPAAVARSDGHQTSDHPICGKFIYSTADPCTRRGSVKKRADRSVVTIHRLPSVQLTPWCGAAAGAADRPVKRPIVIHPISPPS